LAERFQFDNPCIDEEDVQLSERLSDLLGNFALVSRISRVSLDDDYIAQFLASRFQTYVAETCDRDSGAFLKESASSFESDPAGPARDQSALSLKSCHE
jgi:hypothetical protein